MLLATFVFLAGLLLIEKGQGTLEGLIVTPLRSSEYLLAKILSLTVLAVGYDVRNNTQNCGAVLCRCICYALDLTFGIAATSCRLPPNELDRLVRV